MEKTIKGKWNERDVEITIKQLGGFAHLELIDEAIPNTMTTDQRTGKPVLNVQTKLARMYGVAIMRCVTSVRVLDGGVGPNSPINIPDVQGFDFDTFGELVDAINELHGGNVFQQPKKSVSLPSQTESV